MFLCSLRIIPSERKRKRKKKEEMLINIRLDLSHPIRRLVTRHNKRRSYIRVDETTQVLFLHSSKSAFRSSRWWSNEFHPYRYIHIHLLFELAFSSRHFSSRNTTRSAREKKRIKRKKRRKEKKKKKKRKPTKNVTLKT